MVLGYLNKLPLRYSYNKSRELALKTYRISARAAFESSLEWSWECFRPWSLGWAAAPFRFAAGLRLSDTKKWYTTWHFICRLSSVLWRLRDASHFAAFEWNLFGLLRPQLYVSWLRLLLQLESLLCQRLPAVSLRLLSSSMRQQAYMSDCLTERQRIEQEGQASCLYNATVVN